MVGEGGGKVTPWCVFTDGVRKDAFHVEHPTAAREKAATPTTMETTYTALEEGERHDITVEFVTRRAVSRAGERVHRLLVEDAAGEQFAVLLTPENGPLLGVKTGGTYRIDGLLACEPVAEPENVDADCPECGDPLRRGSAVDTVDRSVALAADAFELETLFGVADDRTSVERVRPDRPETDDWQPMRSGGRVGPPDYVCPGCGRRVTEAELRRAGDGRSETADAALEQVNHSPAASDTLGLAAGGAKDANNFRENVANGYTPQPEAISDEGLFYDYYFETGERAESDALFAPRYAAAASEHPLTGETERFLSVGLDSTLSPMEFERPRLDLVAVLDVSASMDSPFNAYYYDEHGRKRDAGDAGSDAEGNTTADGERHSTTKLDAATRSLCALTEQLDEDDRLGVVLYNHRAHVAKPLRDVASTDMPAIQRHIREIAAAGSTNLEDGFEAAVDMLAGGQTGPNAERRVVFMTDMMPNTGATGEDGLTRLFADAAVDGIHTTFVGMGLDANAELTDALSGIRGANHYFVRSAAEFERRLGEEFDYMVTPLVYDLGLDLDAEGYEIAAVHGSPSSEPATDRLVHADTLFPSAKRDGEARGGVILVRLERTREVGQEEEPLGVDLVASWTDRTGREHDERVTVDVPDEPGVYAHSGVRKAVALSRHARELRAWARDVRERADGATGVDDWQQRQERGTQERESVPLAVGEDHADRFERLRRYLEAELSAVGDETLRQELDLLETLLEAAPSRSNGVTE